MMSKVLRFLLQCDQPKSCLEAGRHRGTHVLTSCKCWPNASCRLHKALNYFPNGTLVLLGHGMAANNQGVKVKRNWSLITHTAITMSLRPGSASIKTPNHYGAPMKQLISLWSEEWRMTIGTRIRGPNKLLKTQRLKPYNILITI